MLIWYERKTLLTDWLTSKYNCTKLDANETVIEFAAEVTIKSENSVCLFVLSAISQLCFSFIPNYIMIEFAAEVTIKLETSLRSFGLSANQPAMFFFHTKLDYDRICSRGDDKT